MGVDIYGIEPLLTDTCPQIPDNYDDLSREEQTAFWEKRNAWKAQNPGYYFGNNWWHWRPIQLMIRAFNENFELGIPEDQVNALGSNGGYGITDPEHCKKLAQIFKNFVRVMKEGNETKISVNLGMWYFKKLNQEGTIVHETLHDKDILHQLNLKYPGAFSGKAELNGVEYTTAHETNIDNLEEFILFLENCNGFKVH